jgi:uncharacterized protein YciI
MPYVVLTHDKPDSLELRLATRASHLEYLRLFKDQVLAGGHSSKKMGLSLEVQ